MFGHSCWLIRRDLVVLNAVDYDQINGQDEFLMTFPLDLTSTETVPDAQNSVVDRKDAQWVH